MFFRSERLASVCAGSCARVGTLFAGGEKERSRSEMEQRAGLFGYPLAHSISPAFQQAAFDHYSLPVRYDAWPTPPEELGAEIRKLRGEEFLGANVTVPHKEAVMTLLDGVDPWAELIGAVNTIVNDQGRLIGSNTDADGFIRALREHAGMDPQGQRVLLLGAGGSARAAAFALAKGGAASIAIANRTLSRAESLARDVRKLSGNVTVVPLEGGSLESPDTSGRADLIVNCTSMGMLHGEAEGRTPIDGRLITPGVLVYDLVYNPPETPLLREAQGAGARTLGGLPMLVYQGAASFERWTGKDAPIEVMFEAAESALAGLPRES